jgi:carbamate kinase
MEKTAIIALGGNALSNKQQAGTVKEQFGNTKKSLTEIVKFLRKDYNICITHGNGPQVGDELLRMDLTQDEVPPIPLGICVAGTQGTIGYMIQQTFQNILNQEKIDKEVVTLVTQVVVDPNHPSLKNPTKFVGKRFSKQEAEKRAKSMGWIVKEQDPGEWRRVVPSPDPDFVMHGISIRTLVHAGIIVLAAGGGGIPVFINKDGKFEGIDAVIDKDLTAAKLGRVIRADEYYIVTDIDQVYLNYGTENQSPIDQMNEFLATYYLAENDLLLGIFLPLNLSFDQLEIDFQFHSLNILDRYQ